MCVLSHQVETVVPLGSDKLLRESYINFMNVRASAALFSCWSLLSSSLSALPLFLFSRIIAQQLRIGKVLEDLDAMAGEVAYQVASVPPPPLPGPGFSRSLL